MSNILLMFVLIAAPLMLCVKPIVFGCCLKKEHKEEEFEAIEAKNESNKDENEALL